MIQCEQVVCLDIQAVLLNTHVANYHYYKGLLRAIFVRTHQYT